MIDIESNKRHIFDVVGALHEVHKELGAGLNEYCYVCGILVNFTPKFATIERYFLDKETNEIVGTDGKVKQFL